MPNRRVRARPSGAALTLLALGACVPQGAPPATALPPTPRVVSLPSPPPLAPRPVQTPPLDWQTGPLSPGDWRYRPRPNASSALFQSDGIEFVVLCMGREVTIALSNVWGPLVIRTSYGERRLPPVPIHRETVGRVAVSDPLLDQMAFRRGRFLVGLEGGPWLVVPAWPEIGRVIEDCRGQ